jgi:lipopolysaccharide/colanic/teichoic acid biosynthesis glycosyltransferase
VGLADRGQADSEASATPTEIVCDLKNLSEFMRHHVVDTIVIARSHVDLEEGDTSPFEVAREFGVPLLLLRSAVPGMSNPSDPPILLCRVPGPGPRGFSATAKRALDIVLGSIALLLTLPIIAIAALAIAATAGRPVFFVQKRVGLNGRVFRMFKLRTMSLDAEAKLPHIINLNEVEGPLFKMTRDPRVTRVGRWLRRTSIDELPQLWNVVAGHMALVGPRPLMPHEIAGLDLDGYYRRLSVRPGITGLWQVSGRSLLPFSTCMELDLRYVDNWSLLSDLRLLLRTIPAVALGRGAV